MDETDRISGTFGEIRPNHFHSGTDYKTGEKEGLPVYAAADGYVSRIKVSAVGYGKALYINHPDGNTTVYAHLRAFYRDIADTVKAIQYSTQEFELEFFPGEGKFPVKGGQLIGYSGNSGGSEGPHLHFETRNTLSEKPFDPATLGYLIRDTIAPRILSIAVYLPGPFEALYGCIRKVIPVENPDNPVIADTILTGKEIFIGFETYDLAGMESNMLGNRSYRLFMNDSVVYSCHIHEFSFDETRMVNACIDYPFKKETGRTVMLATRLPGNELAFFGPGSGMIRLPERQPARLRLEVEDGSGNIQKVDFILNHEPSIQNNNMQSGEREYRYGSMLDIIEPDCRIKFPEKAFYENQLIGFSRLADTLNQTLSPVISLTPWTAAVNKPIEISIKYSPATKEIEEKLLIAGVDSAGVLSSAGGRFADGWVTTNIRSLGNYAVALDTVAPVALTPFRRPDDLTGADFLVIPVEDELSGVSKYSCFIEDTWICGEYNAPRGEITIPLEAAAFPGESPAVLKINLTDRKDNKAEYFFPIDL